MRIIWGYLRSIFQYIQTPKGRHDFLDDLRALLIIALTIVIVLVVLKFIL
ncbi:MAG: hypothetical protein ACRCZU_04495 [Selenomonadaceae bacterium]